MPITAIRNATRPAPSRRSPAARDGLDPVRNGQKVLQSKKRGLDVAAAQKLMNTHGGANLDVDGRFGEKTEAAVRTFQGAQKLKVDGKIGKETMAALAAQAAPSAATRPPAPSAGVAARGEPSRTPAPGATVASARRGAAAADATARARIETPGAAADVGVSAGLRAGASTAAKPADAAVSTTAATAAAATPPTTEAQKYDFYKKLVEQKGGKFNEAPGSRNVLAFRQDQNIKKVARGGVYNDKFVMAYKDNAGNKRVREYKGNTDPAASNEGRYGQDLNGDGRKDLGRVPEGHYQYVTGLHNGRARRNGAAALSSKALRPTGTMPAERDTNHDGNFDAKDKNRMGTANDMLFHSGGTNTTSSAGCLTMPPKEWKRFWGDMNKSGNPGKVGVTVMNQNDPVKTGRIAPGASAPAAGDEATAAASALKGATLRRGAEGAQVAAVQQRLSALGYNTGRADGDFGPKTRNAVRAFQRDSGIAVDGVVGPQTYGALNRAGTPSTADPKTPSTPAPPSPVGKGPAAPASGGKKLSDTYTPNAQALAAAKKTSHAKSIARGVEKHGEMYKKAAEMTGVPAAFIAAIHGQESGFGTHKNSINGPESGFGLDPRYVKNDWAQKQLDKRGLGKWQRGVNNSTGRLQSAVIAAEHFKRNAKYAGITVGQNMSAKDIAAASTAYIAGPNSSKTKRAKTSGESFVFKPSDGNPHPYHPGGTSIGPGGRKIRVKPGYKKGLIRWDVMLPLIEQGL